MARFEPPPPARHPVAVHDYHADVLPTANHPNVVLAVIGRHGVSFFVEGGCLISSDWHRLSPQSTGPMAQFFTRTPTVNKLFRRVRAELARIRG